MKLGSLFDGIGGFPLVGTWNGVEPVWASEIEKFPIAVTKKHFPGMKHLGDITKINGAEIEPVDILCGGSPCQDLSVAGKRAGLDGARSGLFMEMIRIIKEMRRSTNGEYPKWVCWENVPGAFSSNKGEDFRCVVEEFCRCADETVSIPRPANGKWTAAGSIVGDGFSFGWRTLDAQYWGVPQRRRRIYAVLDFAGQRAGQILFERESVSGYSAKSGTEGQGTAADVGQGAAGASEHSVVTNYGETAGTLTRRYDSSPCADRGYNVVSGFCQGESQQARSIGWQEEVSPTIKGAPSGIAQTPAIASTFQNTGYGWWNESDIGQTIRTPCGGDSTKANLVCARKTVRRLTPTECERLQGYPDGWTEIGNYATRTVKVKSDDDDEVMSYEYEYEETVMQYTDDSGKTRTCSDSARYKALGNSLALPCANFVIRRIARCL